MSKNQRWVGTVRGAGNEKSWKSELIQNGTRKSEIKNFFRKSEFRPTSDKNKSKT